MGDCLAGVPSGAASKIGRIDVHHHILPPRYIAVVKERIAAVAGPTVDMSRLLHWTPERAIEEMDQNGVAAGITSLGLPGVWLGGVEASRRLARCCNEYGAELCRNYPGRFGMFAALPMPDQEGSLREIAYALDTLKADGFALLTNYGDKWTGDISYEPVFEELNRRKTVVHVHPAVPTCCANLIVGVPPSVTEFLFDTARSIVSLMVSGIFTRYPDIQFIFSHAGGAMPAIANRMAAYFMNRQDLTDRAPNGTMSELKKLHYDIANATSPSNIAALMNLVPSSQLLFGGDYPYINTRLTADGLDNSRLSSDDKQAIDRDNAIRLFPRFKA
jgi:6-methylsalicylate decarboxylase